MLYKKTITLIMAASLFASIGANVCNADYEDISVLYVSADGSDNNSGTKDSPFLTLEKARDTVRQMKSNGSMAKKGAVIYIREGVYSRLESLELTKEDSGSENAPITYRAYPGEKVEFVGGVDIPLADLSEVTDPSIISRITYPNAKENVREAALSNYGISNIPDTPLYGTYSYSVVEPLEGKKLSSVPMELFFGDEVLKIARYPNDSSMTIASVIEPGTTGHNFSDQARESGGGFADDDPIWHEWKPFTIKIEDDRLKEWSKATDAVIGGHFRYLWAEQSTPIKKVDASKGQITSKYPAAFQVAEGMDCYVYNLLEEIDVPGEYYIDAKTKKLYVYPPESGDAESIQVSYLSTPLFDLKDVSYVNIKDIKISAVKSNAIYVNNGEHVNVVGCEVCKIPTAPIVFMNSPYSGADSCYVHDVDGAIKVIGGDLETLTPSNMYITNCEVKNFSRLTGAYTQGIEFQGVGCKVTHNELHESVHMAIGWTGNNHLFAYNEIYDVCTNADDSGAIYAGKYPLCFGNQWIYNYIHDIGSGTTDTGLGSHGFYMDDGIVGGYIAGNVFENISGNGIEHAGREATVTNNLFINIGKDAVYLSNRSVNAESGAGQALKLLLYDYYKSDIWQKAYPKQLEGIEDDMLYTNNWNSRHEVTNNVFVNSGEVLPATDKIRDGSIIENNVSFKTDPGFYDMKNRNYTLKDDSKIYKSIPDFKYIPFTRMGRVDERAEQRASKAVILAIDSPVALLKAKTAYIDDSEERVVPVIRNSSTYVPVRFISEGLGVKVDWNAEEKTVILDDGKITINTTDGKVTKDGVDVDNNETQPFIKNSRTYVPLRLISELLDKDVFWDARGFISISDTKELFNSENDDDIISYLYNKISVQ